MPHALASRIRGQAGLILFLLIGAAIWIALEYFEPRSNWLRVEATPRAVAGQPLIVRVHLAPQPDPGILYADLHGGTSRDKPMQCIATGGPRAVGKEGGTFDYKIMVPRREDLRYVMGVIFWTRSGGWSSHKLAASTKLIPVVTDPAAAPDNRMERLGLQRPRRYSPGHPLAGGASPLADGAAVPGRDDRRRASWPTKRSRADNGGDLRFWRVLVVFLALACLWETLGLESWVGARARALAHAGDFYYPRAAFQKLVISLTVAASLLFLAVIQRVRSSWRLLLVLLVLYAAVSIVSLMSLHAIDRIADLSWHGLTIVQTLKLACASLVLYAMRKASQQRGHLRTLP